MSAGARSDTPRAKECVPCCSVSCMRMGRISEQCGLGEQHGVQVKVHRHGLGAPKGENQALLDAGGARACQLTRP